MRKVILSFLLLFMGITPSNSVEYSLNGTLNQWNQNYKGNRPSATMRDFITNTEYNEISPYLNKTMKSGFNRKVVSRSANSSNIYGVNSNGLYLASNGTSSKSRNIVSRSATTARAGSLSNSFVNKTSSTNTTNKSATNKNSRAIVSRSSTNIRNSSTTNNTSSDTIPILAGEDCYSSYKSCMDNYCSINKTSYKRCFCSDRLAGIEATYAQDIEELLEKIIMLKNGISEWTEADDFSKLGSLTTRLSNIDWAGAENQTKGLNAYETAKVYCIHKLSHCNYMASILQKSYNTEINQDCSSYEQNLKTTKSNAEKIISYYE